MPHPELESSCQSCTLVAQPQPFLLPWSRAQRQELLAYLLVSALLLLFATAMAIAYQYSLPQPQWVELGHVEQFLPGQPVRVDINTMNVWVVNTNKGFIVLHSIANDISRCGIYWEAWKQRFADPCRGTRYTPYGVYAFNGPPPTRSLDRYPVQIHENGHLYIETTQPILGLSMEEFKEECIAQQKGPAWYLEEYWHMGCNIDRITGK